jgi:uncharacterized protein YecT (DUF1311 family)
MKTASLIVLLAAGALGGALRADAQTQNEMNGQTAGEFQAADRQLNSVYQKILTDYADDKVFLASLKEAQRCWIAFRDAQLKMKYPDREPGHYGSIQPVCAANYLAELTRARTAALEVWLAGVEEGDVCAGTVRTKATEPAGNDTP